MGPKYLTTVAFLLTGSALLAQTAQTGAIQGLVKDSSGKPISGAVIIARSGQTERRAVTAENGTYRLALVNVGKWELAFTHSGLQTHTARVQVKINDTQTANVRMIPIAEAVVVVTDTTKSLDVTSTNISTDLSSEIVDKMPRDRSSLNVLDGLLIQTPGVQVIQGGGEYYVRGAMGNQNSLNIDGASANSTMSGGFTSNSRTGSAQPPMEFLESVEVVTGAFGAEYGALGGVVNALTRSGSNVWSGQMFYNMNFPHSEAAGKFNTKMTPPQKAPAISDQYYRYGASVSGPLIKDKLFFFIGYQDFRDVIPPVSTGTNWNHLTSDSQKVSGPKQVNAKINWFINNDHQLILSFGHSQTDLKFGHQYPNASTQAGVLDTGFTTTSTIQTSNLTWNWLVNPSLFIVTSISNFQNPSRTSAVAGGNGTRNDVTVYDYRYFMDGPGSAAGIVKPDHYERVAYLTGSKASQGQYSSNPNRQYRIDLTWLAGIHQVKAGYLLQKTSYHSVNSGMQMWSLYSDRSTYNESWGDPTDLGLLEIGSSDRKFTGTLATYYAKDVVELIPGLRLDVGARFDPFTYKGASGPFNGMELANYSRLGSQLQPRIGLVWDMDNNGKKKVYAHWGRFFDKFSMSMVTWATKSQTRMALWADGTGFQYNPTYQGNGPAFTLLADPYFNQTFGYVGKPSPRAQHLELPHKDTLTFGGDWNYNDNWSFGSFWTMWEMKNVMEDSWFLNPDGSLALGEASNPDGSPRLREVNQKVLWNPRPGPVTIIDSDGNARTWNSNFPNPKNRYIGLNLHGQYAAENLRINVSYDWTHHYGNVGGGVPNNIANNAGNAEVDSFTQGTTKDFDFASSIGSGNNEGSPVHLFKCNGSYSFHIGEHRLDLSPSIIWQSGLGLSGFVASALRYRETSRNSTFAGDLDTPVLVNNQRCNMGYLPSTLIMDLGIQDTFTFKGVRVVPNLSVMNLFNTRPVTGRKTLFDEGRAQDKPVPYVNYGMVSAWQPGRSITAGVSLQF